MISSLSQTYIYYGQRDAGVSVVQSIQCFSSYRQTAERGRLVAELTWYILLIWWLPLFPGERLGMLWEESWTLKGEPLRSAPDVGLTHVWTLQMKLVEGSDRFSSRSTAEPGFSSLVQVKTEMSKFPVKQKVGRMCSGNWEVNVSGPFPWCQIVSDWLASCTVVLASCP